MIIKYIPYDEYIAMFDRLKQTLRVVPDPLDPSVYSEEERREYIRKQFNPDIPLSIVMYTDEGPVKYLVGRK